MGKFFYTFINIIIYTAFLSPIVWLAWNFGVHKFFPGTPLVEWKDSVVVLAAFQTLSIFTLRPIHREMVPIYIPNKELDDAPSE